KRGKLIRSFVVVGLLWYYAYITGFSSSIIRATIMFSIIVIGHGMRREVNIYNSLAIAALVLLIINPNYLFDVGFQLSFSAVIGIVWIFPMLNKLWRPRSKVVRYVWSLLIVSIAAQIATFPFTVFYFHKFSGLFFVANIIEIPLITILLAFSYLIIVLLMFGFEYNLLVYIYDKTVNVIEWVSLEISRIESMIFDDIFIDKLTVVILFILIISTIILFQTKKNKYLFVGLMAIVSLQLTVIYQRVKTSNKQVLMIAKNEILLQNSNEYSTNKEEGAKLFSNYTKAKKLKLTTPILEDIFSFDNKYYWRIGENIESNPIQEQHSIIVDKQSKSNPEKIVNNNSVGV
ncbi:MAG: ComEC/Rec2 family competence protein, partial [Flavobacteriales bacterium]|nr:ComEC/Rec2 family competence protein [Flavobacteriales bacterium]